MSMKYFFSDQPTLSRFHIHPLGRYLDSYAAHLRDQGYDRNTARVKIRTIARFSPWLKRHGIAAIDLNLGHIQDYLSMTVRKGPRLTKEDGAALRQFAEFLHAKGVIAEQIVPPIETTAIQQMVDEYALYLRNERALASGTIAQYESRVSQFLDARFAHGVVDLSTLRATDVITFVASAASNLSRKGAKLVTSALRSFLRYARYHGYIDADLAASVPSVANWATVSIPRSLPREQVELVLACVDRRTAIGQRDYAILLLLARLGLRAGEVVSLRLEDIDWRAGCITVHGKGSHLAQMPMPPDVGEAIALYLRSSRPKSSSRAVFLTANGPITGFARAGAISSIVSRALQHAGIETKRRGAHQFRHALAIELLRTGASLPEIAEVLRHRTLQCTTMYAKVDFASLRPLGLPWPGGVQ